MPEVERMLDRLVELEGNPEVVQFSGGEPTIHPQILDFVAAAQARGIPHVMINTNGVRIAADDAFVAALAELRPSIYLQFDGLQVKTHLALRGQDLRETKARALDRLSAAGWMWSLWRRSSGTSTITSSVISFALVWGIRRSVASPFSRSRTWGDTLTSTRCSE